MKKAFLTFMTVIMVLLSAGCGGIGPVRNKSMFTVTAVNGTEEVINQINVYVYCGYELLEALPLDNVQDAVLNPGSKAQRDYDRISAQTGAQNGELRLVVEVMDSEGNVHHVYPEIGFMLTEGKDYEITICGSMKDGYTLNAGFEHNEYAEESVSGQTIGMDVFRRLFNRNDNICYSPLSLEIALKMLYEGARGETLKQFTDRKTGLLRINTSKAEIANSMWADDELKVEEAYLKALLEKYSAEVFNTDLTGDTYEKINDWISSKTHELIKRVFFEPLPDSMAMVLVNAIYFKAAWCRQLMNLGIADFTNTSGKKVSAEYVGDTGTYLTFDVNDYSGMIIPYDDEGTCFMAIRAPESGAVPDYETLMKLYEQAQYERVEFRMPKLDIEYTRKLNDDVMACGLSDIFNSQTADLSGIGSSPKGPLAVSMILQKCHLKLDENGTEAAAVTVIGVETTAYMPDTPRRMYFDSPYFYAIINNGAVMFIGYVNNPEVSM
ncbi:MAG: hypothetical protein IJM79_08170 [Erysipelotrichaceae bacterium]|nr:hypothetical protein [Erysipelotrichaceae bacterium]